MNEIEQTLKKNGLDKEGRTLSNRSIQLLET